MKFREVGPENSFVVKYSDFQNFSLDYFNMYLEYTVDIDGKPNCDVRNCGHKTHSKH